ncbi:MAG: hypothetical protein AAF847_12935 [Bacteroidota bacterium]
MNNRNESKITLQILADFASHPLAVHSLEYSATHPLAWFSHLKVHWTFTLRDRSFTLWDRSFILIQRYKKPYRTYAMSGFYALAKKKITASKFVNLFISHS